MKFYAVRKGRKVGIFNTWQETKENVVNFSGAEYKSFNSMEAAQAYLNADKPVVDDYSDCDIIVYTDGGCRNNGVHKGGHVKKDDKAAWAYTIRCKDEACSIDGVGGERGATNNQMELTGLIEAIEMLIKKNWQNKKIRFCLDSKYVIENIYRLSTWKAAGWRNTSGLVANKDKWQKLEPLLQECTNKSFVWVKGHADSDGNNYVDRKLNEYMDDEM